MIEEKNLIGNSMSSELVVKSNRLNSAIQNLSLSEIRLIQLGIIDSREHNQGLSAGKPLRIDAMRYAKVFDIGKQTAYEALLDAELTLFERRFTFLDEKENKVKSRWISQVKYIKGEGAIEIIFTPAVVNEISRINGVEQFFTKYTLQQVVGLKSAYSMRLYELLSQWREAKRTPLFELEEFRGQLGVGVNEYTQMCGFKRRVLDFGVSEINKKTDLKVSYEQVKKGRKIVGFKFRVLEKQKAKNERVKQDKERDSDNGDIFTIDGLSDKQLGRIARHKEFVNTYSNLAKGDAGKDWKAFNKFMVDLIKKDPDRFSRKRPLREYLDGKDEDYIYT